MITGGLFKPRILGFLCNWCCYGGADLCGVSRFQYPPYIRVIRIMCSGRVDPAFVLRAFSKGADGVFIGGCHINDCHYNTEGNYDALAMTMIVKKILKLTGINPERLRLEWVSASEGIRFAGIMNEYGNRIKELGPLSGDCERGMEDAISALKAAEMIVPYIKLVERERLRPLVRSEEEYRDFYQSEEFDTLFKDLIEDRLCLAGIMRLLREKPLSAGEISQRTGTAPSEIFRHINSSVRRGLVRYDEENKQFVVM